MSPTPILRESSPPRDLRPCCLTGETPTSRDDRSRVNKTSSVDLDQLRLEFQRQKGDVMRSRSELDDLRKMLVDAQQRLSAERDGRRRLQQWTEYLEREIRTYLRSRKNDENRYQKTQPVIERLQACTR